MRFGAKSGCIQLLVTWSHANARPLLNAHTSTQRAERTQQRPSPMIVRRMCTSSTSSAPRTSTPTCPWVSWVGLVGLREDWSGGWRSGVAQVQCKLWFIVMVTGCSPAVPRRSLQPPPQPKRARLMLRSTATAPGSSARRRAESSPASSERRGWSDGAPAVDRSQQQRRRYAAAAARSSCATGFEPSQQHCPRDPTPPPLKHNPTRDIKDKVSPPCKSQIFKIQKAAAADLRADPALEEACHEDADRLCKDVKDGGGRKQACLVGWRGGVGVVG